MRECERWKARGRERERGKEGRGSGGALRRERLGSCPAIEDTSTYRSLAY